MINVSIILLRSEFYTVKEENRPSIKPFKTDKIIKSISYLCLTLV